MRSPFFLALLLATACSAPAMPTAPAQRGPATCAAVCARYRELGCAAAAPTPRGGVSCEVVCSEVTATGLVRWDLGCRSAAASCAAAETCEAP